MNRSTVFNALVVRELENGQFSREIEKKKIVELPEGEVIVKNQFESYYLSNFISLGTLGFIIINQSGGIKLKSIDAG